ncbi:MAG: hypothetical protein GY801_25460, partial [bacterium]|nr:hypothetical protein [bacterium]
MAIQVQKKPSLMTSDLSWACILFTGALFVYLLTVCKSFANGDAAAYAMEVVKWEFERPVHVGFFILGRGMYEVLSSLFSCSVLMSLNILAAISGALGVMCCFLWVARITKNRTIGVLASLLLLFSGLYWISSTFGEIYTTQVALILGAMAFLVRNKIILSAVFYGGAMLISPLSVLVLPYFLYHIFCSEKRWRILMVFGLVSLLVYSAGVFPFFRHYFFGERGLFTASTEMSASLSTYAMAGKVFIKSSIEYLNFICIFIVFGLYLIVVKKENVCLALSTVLVFVFHFLVAIRSLNDGFLIGKAGEFYLPLHPFLVAIAAYGIYESTFRLSQKSKYVLCGITIVFFAAVSYLQVVQPHRSYSDNFKGFSEQLHEELPTDAHLLFDDFHLGGLYNYYTMGKFYSD